MRKKTKLTPLDSTKVKQQDVDTSTRRRLPNTPEGVVLRQKPGRSKTSRDFGHLSPIRKSRSRPPSIDYAGNVKSMVCCVTNFYS